MRIRGHAPFAVIAAVIAAFSLTGCATVRHPVPQNLTDKAFIGTMDDVRMMQGEHHTKLQESLIESIVQEAPGDYPADADGVKTYPILAISGGGANGAYGAGLLKGWSEEGSRPKFKVVTGVSTGAISAPYVFLGKDYDCELEQYYTTMSTKDVMAAKGPLAILFGDSIASNKPLDKIIARAASPEMLERIAAEHRRGRRLFVGTCNIDAQKFVVWDMGAIAAKGDVDLFRRVIVASAAMPVIFPPSVFHVDADGQCYDEFHTDGGTITQVFALARMLDGMQGVAKHLGVDPSKVKGRLYIIRNGYMSPKYSPVKDNLPSLAARCFDVIIDSQGIGDAYRIYTFTKQTGTDYNLAFIPPDYKDESKEMFDPCAMRKLFRRGYDDAVKGYKWHKVPPGMEGPPQQPQEPQQEAAKQAR
jgi:hypothetical protein